MDVHEIHVSLTSGIKPFPVTDSGRPRDVNTEFVIGFRAGIVGRRKEYGGVVAAWSRDTVESKKGVVAGHQHASKTDVVEPTSNLDDQRYRLAGREWGT